MKRRIDVLLVDRGMAESREKARALVMAGEVYVDGMTAAKPSMQVTENSEISLRDKPPFVGRGGIKVNHALDEFHIDVTGLTAADIGASTGGFTDCLLQYGAKKIYAVDVGYGQLDWKLRQDERVVVLERTNARFLTRQQIADPLDLAVIDASFISLEPLLAPLVPLFRDKVQILALVKPQFQLPRESVGPHGIVTESALHHQALAMVKAFGEQQGLHCTAIVASPICGAKGNQEFFMLLTGPRTESGETHLLSASSAKVIETLSAGPCRLEELVRSVADGGGVSTSRPLQRRVREVCRHLCEVGIIESECVPAD